MKKLLFIILLLLPVTSFGIEISENQIKHIGSVIAEDFSKATGYTINPLIKVGDFKSRGGASKHRIKIDPTHIKTRKELISVIIHEMGHYLAYHMNGMGEVSEFTDFGYKVYTVDNPFISFVDICRSDEETRSGCMQDDFASNYGMVEHSHEDWSESITMYLVHRNRMISKAKKSEAMRQKLMFMHNLFNGWYYMDGKDTDELVRDVTTLL